MCGVSFDSGLDCGICTSHTCAGPLNQMAAEQWCNEYKNLAYIYQNKSAFTGGRPLALQNGKQ